MPAPSPSPAPTLTNDEIARYSRHLILPEVGMDGQRRLKGSSVLCVGAGGLGSPLLMYLAAAGVGRIGIVDFDTVDRSNLQRQIIHGTSTLGQPKLDSARARVLDINPHCQVDCFAEAITSANALDLIAPYDVVVDGTDNFPTRYLINDACVILGKPNIYGSIFRFEGQASVFNHEGGPHYRDLYPEPPPPGMVPSCAEGGVLGVLPGVIGAIQATETLKVLLGLGNTLSGRLLLYDALNMTFRELKMRKDPNAPDITKLVDYQEFCGAPDAPPAEGFHRRDAQQVAQKLADGWTPLWIDVRRPDEWDIVKLPEAELFVPHLQLMQDGLSGVELDRPILLQCKSGRRSATAATALLAAGFTNVTNLEGGILGWVAQFRPDLPSY